MHPDGKRPLSPEELADLIPSLATKEELNEWEFMNILRAREWALRDRTSPIEIVTDRYVRKLHGRMFDQTWKWAGQYRRSEKNLGISLHDIREAVAALCGDAAYWIENQTYTPDELAVRFHHRLVAIHLFPNGNGRHGRLLADVLVKKLGEPLFTWGSLSLVKPGAARSRYLEALHKADAGEIGMLLQFARS